MVNNITASIESVLYSTYRQAPSYLVAQLSQTILNSVGNLFSKILEILKNGLPGTALAEETTSKLLVKLNLTSEL